MQDYKRYLTPILIEFVTLALNEVGIWLCAGTNAILDVPFGFLSVILLISSR